jgi:hypothetical protein
VAAMMRLFLMAGAVALALALCACKKEAQSGLYDKLYASDFGVKVHFNISSDMGQDLLGPPTGRTTRQGGASVTDFYLGEGLTALDSDTPQLSVTYLNDKLMRLYNRYYPEDSSRPLAPFFIEPVPGVKLGNRKSEFVKALGNPTDAVSENKWVFTNKDGESITIITDFVDVPAAGESLCCALAIAYTPAAEQLRGEEYKKQQEAEKKMRGK